MAREKSNRGECWDDWREWVQWADAIFCQKHFTSEIAWTFHGRVCPKVCCKSSHSQILAKFVDSFSKRQQTPNRVYELFLNDPSTLICELFAIFLQFARLVMKLHSNVFKARQSLFCPQAVTLCAFWTLTTAVSPAVFPRIAMSHGNALLAHFSALKNE